MPKEKHQASGRFVLRTGGRLHARLRERATDAHVSLNQLCVDLLERGLHGAATAGPGAGIGPNPEDIATIAATFGEQLAAIILFGSAARGEAWHNDASDIDLLLVLGRDQPLTRSLYTEWDRRASQLVERRYSPQFVQFPNDVQQLGSIWLEAAIDGRVLWDPTGEVGRALRRLRDGILDGKWRRRTLHGQGYWIREEEP